jgi:hypothetical protein
VGELRLLDERFPEIEGKRLRDLLAHYRDEPECRSSG